LQNAKQFRLEGGGQFAHLIQKDGSAFGLFQAALLLGEGAGEGALLVAEQLAFEATSSATRWRRAISTATDATTWRSGFRSKI